MRTIPSRLGLQVTEHSECRILADYLNLKRIPFCHVPNEGKRSLATGARMKQIGLQKGFPDVLVFKSPPRALEKKGVAIEMKRVNGGRVSKEQKQWLEILKSEGWLVFVTQGATQAITTLQSLGF